MYRQQHSAVWIYGRKCATTCRGAKKYHKTNKNRIEIRKKLNKITTNQHKTQILKDCHLLSIYCDHFTYTAQMHTNKDGIRVNFGAFWFYICSVWFCLFGFRSIFFGLFVLLFFWFFFWKGLFSPSLRADIVRGELKSNLQTFMKTRVESKWLTITKFSVCCNSI